MVKQVLLRALSPLTALMLAAALVLPAAAQSTAAAEQAAGAVAEGFSCTTYQGVCVQGQLRGVSTGGGTLRYEIVEQPAKGTVTLEETGRFIYTPQGNKTGKDVFTYLVRDEADNTSAPAEVKIQIVKGKSGVRYADMQTNGAHAAAVRMAESGIFTGRQVGGQYFFDPDAPVSRSEFLAMAMAAAGLNATEDVSVTGFSDDASIPAWAKAYASEALNKGVISGKVDNDRIVFSADEPITYSEAATILNRTLAVTDVNVDTLAQNNVPAWAVQPVANLSSVRVLGDGADCGAKLNRMAAAELLCAAMDVAGSGRANGPFAWLK